jgi:hypothetical protein
MGDTLKKESKLIKHGHTRGGIESIEYRTYSGMKNKCCNPNYVRYDLYGGRGITICEEWMNSFEQFLIDLGPMPDGAVLGRIDENKNFDPENARWMSKGDYIRSLPSSFGYRKHPRMSAKKRKLQEMLALIPIKRRNNGN